MMFSARSLLLLLTIACCGVTAAGEPGTKPTNSLLAGSWVGTDTYTDPETGETLTVEAELIIAPHGENPRDYVFWNSELMGIARHQRDDQYIYEEWFATGRFSSFEAVVQREYGEAYDTTTERFTRVDYDGVRRESIVTYKSTESDFAYEMESRLAGSSEDFRVVATGSFKRKADAQAP